MSMRTLVLDWYRDKPARRADPDWREKRHHRRVEKFEVRERIKSCSGLDICMRDQRFKWLGDLASARRRASNYSNKPDRRAEMVRTHRHIARLMRNTRFDICTTIPDGRAFYSDASTKHVCFDPDDLQGSEFHKAEKVGVEFTHKFVTVSLVEFRRLRRYMCENGVEGYWSSSFNTEDVNISEADVFDSVFMFSTERDIETFDEGRVWIKMKYV